MGFAGREAFIAADVGRESIATLLVTGLPARRTRAGRPLR